MYRRTYIYRKGFGFAEPQMVRSVSHLEDEENHDSSSPTGNFVFSYIVVANICVCVLF